MRYGWSMPAVALTIAGSDPSGGAGIQADLKTFHQFGVYGEAVITLLTVQNSQTVSQVEVLSADLVAQQIQAVAADIPPNAAKTGALGSIEIVEAVAQLAGKFSFPLVVDPVMVSKPGKRLLSAEAQRALQQMLFPHAFLITPNLPETEALTGMSIQTEEDTADAAERLLDLGCKAVLIKGGHRSGQPDDFLADRDHKMILPGTRVTGVHTHGTGCTYSAAITACLALGHCLDEAVSRAKSYIQRAIQEAPQLGRGHGPLNHFANTSAPSDPLYRSRR